VVASFGEFRIGTLQQSVDFGIAATVTAVAAYGGSYAVPSGRQGWLQWGNWGWSYAFKNGYYNEACKYVYEGSGTGKSPRKPGKSFNHGAVSRGIAERGQSRVGSIRVRPRQAPLDRPE